MCNNNEYDFEHILSRYIRNLKNKNFENVYTYRRIIIGYALNRNKFTELYQTVNAVESVISNSNCNNEIISISKKEIKCFLEVYLPPVPIGFGVKKNDKIKIK